MRISAWSLVTTYGYVWPALQISHFKSYETSWLFTSIQVLPECSQYVPTLLTTSCARTVYHQHPVSLCTPVYEMRLRHK